MKRENSSRRRNLKNPLPFHRSFDPNLDAKPFA